MERNKTGFTLVELLVVVAILAVLVGLSVIALNPLELMRKSRDAARLTDTASIRKALDLVTTGGSTLNSASCTVLTPCSSLDGTRSSDGTGWINVDLSKYLPALPVDPKALDGSFADALGRLVQAEYQFANDGSYYLLRIHLESSANALLYSTDGGRSDSWYEVGTKLTLLE